MADQNFASAQYLFDRAWSVTIGLPGEAGFKYDKLKTTFEIEKTSASYANKAKIELYNLNDQSRLNFQRKGLQIRLEAGYRGLTEVLYIGDVTKTQTQRKGPDIVTLFEAGDSEKQLTTAHFNKSYPAGVTFLQIISDMVKALNVNQGPIIGIPNVKYNNGFTVSGSIKTIMDTLIPNQGLEWSIQNGYLQIIPVTAHNGDEAVFLSQDTGLIGIPSQKDSGVEFISLLNPKLLPGMPVQLDSKLFKGFYKIKKSKIEGDSHGQKWNITCEGVRINAANAAAFRSTTIGNTA